jgi:casein kinase 1
MLCPGKTVGVPQVHHFGQEGLHNVLAIDLLGPNLEDLFDMCGRKFSIKTVCMAAKQMVSPTSLMVGPCVAWCARTLC